MTNEQRVCLRLARIKAYRESGTTVGGHDVDWLLRQLAEAESKLADAIKNDARYRWVRDGERSTGEFAALSESHCFEVTMDEYIDEQMIGETL